MYVFWFEEVIIKEQSIAICIPRVTLPYKLKLKQNIVRI